MQPPKTKHLYSSHDLDEQNMQCASQYAEMNSVQVRKIEHECFMKNLELSLHVRCATGPIHWLAMG